jgi:hypothetical protein
MLIDPSVQSLANAGLPGSLLSFGTPCLKWKLFAACHIHWGFNGYDSAIYPANRYLAKTVVFTDQLITTNDSTGVSTTYTYPDSGTYVITVDRISGAGMQSGVPVGEGPIGGGGIITYQGDTQKTVDGSFTQNYGGVTYQNVKIWVVTLSNQYTFAMLDADLDALIAQIDPDDYPVQTLTPIAYSADPNPAGASAAMAFIPAPYNYPFMNSPPFVEFGVSYPVGSLAAAAISAYNPLRRNGGASPLSNPGMMKLAGWLAMAGDYCLKTYTATYGGTIDAASPPCVSGRGTCSSWFFVQASPATPGGNSFVAAIPNCQC